MDYVAMTAHLWPSNYSVGHKRLERVPSNSANHCSRALLIESDVIHVAIDDCELMPFSVQPSITYDIQNHITIVAV